MQKKYMLLFFVFFCFQSDIYAMKRNGVHVEAPASKRIYKIEPGYYESIETLKEQATFGSWRDLNEGDAFSRGGANIPLNIQFRKSTVAPPAYPDGIYEFKILDCTKNANATLFNQYEWLKNKGQALLYVTFINAAHNCTVALPTMDTFIVGNDLDNSTFFLGSSNVANNHKYFFKNRLKSEQKIKIRLHGTVFAARPTDFIPFGNLSHRPIIPLFKNKLSQFKDEHTDENGGIIFQDQHPTKIARSHQIEQIYHYAQAKEKNIKYLTFSAATGSGKSYTMQRISQLVQPSKVLIVTSRTNLVDQFAQQFSVDFPHLNIAAHDAHKISLSSFLPLAIKNNDVVIITLQALQSNYNKPKILDKINIIMFDEAHNLLSKNRSDMIKTLKVKNALLEILFFTATPTVLERHKKSSLTSVYELSDEQSDDAHHIKEIDLKHAIDLKVNAPFQIAHVTSTELVRFKRNGSEYNLDDVAQHLSQVKYHRVVLDIFANLQINNGEHSTPVHNKLAMAFCANIAHAEGLARYLNEQQPNGIDAHKQAYESRLREFILSFAEKENTHSLRPLLSALKRGVKHGYTRAELERIYDAFIKEFPYVFADAVHSGNKIFDATDNNNSGKLIRNNFGGSTILCGSDKLTEGYDNPLISLLFMMSPVRNSNIKSKQRFGRGLRIDPENPNKVTVAIEFIFDEQQLLLSSADLMNCMYYGLPKPLNFLFEHHLEGIAPYTIKNHCTRVGSLHKESRPKIRPLNVSSECTRVKKTKPQDMSDEILLAEVKQALQRLRKANKKLQEYQLLEEALEKAVPFDDELLGHMPSRALAPALTSQDQDIQNNNINTVFELFGGNIQREVTEVNNFFVSSRPLPIYDKVVNKEDIVTTTISNSPPLKPTATSLLSKREQLLQLLKRAKAATKAAKNFMTGCELAHNFAENVADIFAEFSTVTRTQPSSETVPEIISSPPLVSQAEYVPRIQVFQVAQSLGQPSNYKNNKVVIDLSEEPAAPFYLDQKAFELLTNPNTVVPLMPNHLIICPHLNSLDLSGLNTLLSMWPNEFSPITQISVGQNGLFDVFNWPENLPNLEHISMHAPKIYLNEYFFHDLIFSKLGKLETLSVNADEISVSDDFITRIKFFGWSLESSNQENHKIQWIFRRLININSSVELNTFLDSNAKAWADSLKIGLPFKFCWLEQVVHPFLLSPSLDIDPKSLMSLWIDYFAKHCQVILNDISINTQWYTSFIKNICGFVGENEVPYFSMRLVALHKIFEIGIRSDVKPLLENSISKLVRIILQRYYK
jgi:superfamily II DNA or RNA helicase